MIAARLKSNGMFLKRFGGSYNRQIDLTQFRIEARKNPGEKTLVSAGFIRATKDEVLAELFCRPSLHDAKLYCNEKGAKFALTGHFSLVDLVPVSLNIAESRSGST